VEQGIWKLPPGEADIVRSKVTSILKRHNSVACNLRPWELKAIKELRSLSDILFMKADKGNMTVIMNKQDYDEKLFEMLKNGETYEDLKRYPTPKNEKLLNKFISRLLDKQQITQGECFTLKSSDVLAPRLYGQPKVHKPDIPLRPIVSFIGSPTYALSKKIVNILAPLVGNTEFHGTRNFMRVTQVISLNPLTTYDWKTMKFWCLVTSYHCLQTSQQLQQ